MALLQERFEQKRTLQQWSAILSAPGSLVTLWVLAAMLWFGSLPQVDPRAMNDLGLVSVLPPQIFMALALMVVGFIVNLSVSPLRRWIVLLYLVTMIGMLYGITALVEETPRFSTAWKLAGIADYIRVNGSVDRTIDAFFNWPGFFILGAFFTSLAGLPSVLSIAAWAHVGFNLLNLAPLLLILRAGTSDTRLVWTGAWIFFLANWIGQDYFAPQSFNYFLYLCLLAILLTWFKVPVPHVREGMLDTEMRSSVPRRGLAGWSWKRISMAEVRHIIDGWRRAPETHGTRRTVALAVIAMLFFAVMVPSHQLTPFAALGIITTLVVSNRVTMRSLPLLMVVILGTWISFMTVEYLSGHLDHVAAPVGNLGQNLNANVTRRLAGSDQHIFVLRMRLVMSVVLWSVALGGIIRRLWKGYWDVPHLALAAVPFGLVALQAYGGELMLRVYLYVLPGMAFFAAALFYPSLTAGRTWRTPIALALVSTVLLTGFQFTRYGNERADNFTSAEYNAVRVLYAVAEPGSQLIALTDTLPWRYRDYNNYRYDIATGRLRRGDIEGLVEQMSDAQYPSSYLIITRAQKASAELFHGMALGAGDEFERSLLESGSFDVVYMNEDATILELKPR